METEMRTRAQETDHGTQRPDVAGEAKNVSLGSRFF